jgi:hypothetical protein
MGEEGTFKLALDGEQKDLTSNHFDAGHLLWSGVPSKEQASRMRDVLLGSSMFSGWESELSAQFIPYSIP